MSENNIRSLLEEKEKQTLSSRASLSIHSRGRKRPEPESPVRTVYMRDRDRIIHSTAFRRLKHKTQVFILSINDLIRTRMTHTLEVSQISRTIAKALGLNEDLVEAIALGHDLGHTPFGHAGERMLNQVFSRGFRHNLQSLRTVDFLEKHGKGLNLSYEVRDGILKHSKWGEALFSTRSFLEPITQEGQIVKICDRIAYINHDIDDAIRCEIISKNDIPAEILMNLGESHSQRINLIVSDMIKESLKNGTIVMSPKIQKLIELTRSYLFEKVYFNHFIEKESEKASKVISDLYYFYIANPIILMEKTMDIQYPKGTSIQRRAVDYISMMTDNYALEEYKKYLLPKKWFSFEGI